MEIIANTKDGFLISATHEEVVSILKATNGSVPEAKDIKIGHRLPAIDYAGTITKIKSLADNDRLKYMFDYMKQFVETAKGLKDAIDKASTETF